MTISTNGLGSTRRGWTLVLLGLFATASLPAQTFTNLFTFDYNDGWEPMAPLVQGANGQLYGTAYECGSPVDGGCLTGGGSLFEITTGGTFTLLDLLSTESGPLNPVGGLVQAANGDFLGTTIRGGASYCCGTVFAMTPTGTVSTVYSFCQQPNCADGSEPECSLVRGTDENYYGTTLEGGAYGGGTVFKVSPGGTFTSLYSFCAQTGCPDGEGPRAALVLAASGDFYGTTGGGGANAGGTVFRITSSGALTTVYSFCSQPSCADGSNSPGLIQGTDGDFYGVTSYKGAYGGGTVFKLTPSGELTTLYSFCAQSNCPDGYQPEAPPTEGTDGNFYVTASGGGTLCTPFVNSCGTIFRITPKGVLTTIFQFNFNNGDYPIASLVQSTNGVFYGTTDFAQDTGNIFSISVGLKPFVTTGPSYGASGAVVEIQGTNLTGATRVTFNGTAAAFKVIQASQIVAEVPKGASTGKIEVVTPTETLSSKLTFRVLP